MTILEAVTECEYWIQRDGEITRLLELNPGWNLDLPATIRYKIVRRLITDELRAHTAKDIGLRFRFMVDVEIIRRSECSALERDLKELLELKGKATANSSPRWAEARTGAQVRREAVETMLSDPAGVLLSDREIARRTGVSPQTVGNIRRRLDL
jgi:hypothetical protein